MARHKVGKFQENLYLPYLGPQQYLDLPQTLAVFPPWHFLLCLLCIWNIHGLILILFQTDRKYIQGYVTQWQQGKHWIYNDSRVLCVCVYWWSCCPFIGKFTNKECKNILEDTYNDCRNLGGLLIASSMMMAISTDDIWSTNRFCLACTELASSTSWKFYIFRIKIPRQNSAFLPVLLFSKVKVLQDPNLLPILANFFWLLSGQW